MTGRSCKALRERGYFYARALAIGTAKREVSGVLGLGSKAPPEPERIEKHETREVVLRVACGRLAHQRAKTHPYASSAQPSRATQRLLGVNTRQNHHQSTTAAAAVMHRCNICDDLIISASFFWGFFGAASSLLNLDLFPPSQRRLALLLEDRQFADLQALW